MHDRINLSPGEKIFQNLLESPKSNINDLNSVDDFLRDIQLTQYSSTFKENQILNFKDLKLLTKQDLQDMGISIGLRNKILKEIRDRFFPQNGIKKLGQQLKQQSPICKFVNTKSNILQHKFDAKKKTRVSSARARLKLDLQRKISNNQSNGLSSKNKSKPQRDFKSSNSASNEDSLFQNSQILKDFNIQVSTEKSQEDDVSKAIIGLQLQEGRAISPILNTERLIPLTERTKRQLDNEVFNFLKEVENIKINTSRTQGKHNLSFIQNQSGKAQEKYPSRTNFRQVSPQENQAQYLKDKALHKKNQTSPPQQKEEIKQEREPYQKKLKKQRFLLRFLKQNIQQKEQKFEDSKQSKNNESKSQKQKHITEDQEEIYSQNSSQNKQLENKKQDPPQKWKIKQAKSQESQEIKQINVSSSRSSSFKLINCNSPQNHQEKTDKQLIKTLIDLVKQQQQMILQVQHEQDSIKEMISVSFLFQKLNIITPKKQILLSNPDENVQI